MGELRRGSCNPTSTACSVLITSPALWLRAAIYYPAQAIHVRRILPYKNQYRGQSAFHDEAPGFFQNSEKRCLAADPGAIQEEQTASGVIRAFTTSSGTDP